MAAIGSGAFGGGRLQEHGVLQNGGLFGAVTVLEGEGGVLPTQSFHEGGGAELLGGVGLESACVGAARGDGAGVEDGFVGDVGRDVVFLGLEESEGGVGGLHDVAESRGRDDLRLGGDEDAEGRAGAVAPAG